MNRHRYENLARASNKNLAYFYDDKYNICIIAVQTMFEVFVVFASANCVC